ncbi:mediator complex, subunit Med10 [Actinidia rufa]|uniref:Mediator of RNA polymerase II transcription subunit 10 n=1 Tax=Actinidia rufa TaxID=165716 RepID=A0A7J0DX17_9ERIC|nr:mediator complex, subunit Med10 [Actinidia rufa]
MNFERPRPDRLYLLVCADRRPVSEVDNHQKQWNSLQNSGGNGIIAPQTNDPSAATATATETKADDPKQNLNQVINSIHKTLGLTHQLYLTVSSFNIASQLPLLQRLNSLVMELDNMTKMADKCKYTGPPAGRQGKNPDEFTKDVLNGCIAKNQITKGKADAFKGLRRHLLEELEQAFPDEVESYREIRTTSAAELKRLAQAQSMLPNGDVKVKPEL